MSVDFGPKIRRLRLVRGLSLAAMAKKMGITEEALVEMETWESQPPMAVVNKAAGILGIGNIILLVDAPHCFEQIVILACSQQLDIDALKSFTAGMEEVVKALRAVELEKERKGS